MKYNDMNINEWDLCNDLNRLSYVFKNVLKCHKKEKQELPRESVINFLAKFQNAIDGYKENTI